MNAKKMKSVSKIVVSIVPFSLLMFAILNSTAEESYGLKR
jgi:hypothetical protein